MLETKKCTKCGGEFDLSFFNKKKEASSGLQFWCKDCQHKASRQHYKSNKINYIRRTSERNYRVKLDITTFILEYLKEHPCADCGESDPIVLEFDHIKGPKLFNISSAICRRINIFSILEEIAKCEVRCSNCHKRKTAKEYNWYKVVNDPK